VSREQNKGNELNIRSLLVRGLIDCKEIKNKMYNMKTLRQMNIIFVSMLLIINLYLFMLIRTFFSVFVLGFLVGILIERLFNYSLDNSKDKLLDTSMSLNKKILKMVKERIDEAEKPKQKKK